MAQMIGSLFMGKFSDSKGRRPAFLICTAASSLQYFVMSQNNSLLGKILLFFLSIKF